MATESPDDRARQDGSERAAARDEGGAAAAGTAAAAEAGSGELDALDRLLAAAEALAACSETHLARASASSLASGLDRNDSSDEPTTPRSQEHSHEQLAQTPPPASTPAVNAELALARSHAAAAIRCFEALLSPRDHPGTGVPSRPAVGVGTLTPMAEARARLGLARVLWRFTDSEPAVERHLSKLTTRLQELSFWALDLQLDMCAANHNGNRAKQILKQAIDRATELKMHVWCMHFLARRLRMQEAAQDWTACIASAAKASAQASAAGDLAMALHFAAARTRTCLFAGTLASAEQSIRDFDALLAEAGVGLSEVDPLHQQPEAAAADADARTSAVLPEFAEPLLLRHMASVLLHLRTGNNKHALSLLAPIHSIIEAHSQQLSNQLVLLAYLFSGLVHKPDETFKAKMFLVEGLKLASVVTESGDLASRLDVARTRVAMLSSLGHVCLSRAEFLEAFDAVKTGTQLCLEHDDLLQEFEQQLKLDWAMVLQALGRFDDASTLYEQLARHSTQQAHARSRQRASQAADDAGAETELEWFAAFHRSLILHCASGADEHQVQIEHVPDVPENASLRLKSFGSFVHGCLEARAGNTKQAKQRILEAFKTAEVTTSAHMRVVCLGALSGLFVLSDPAQADKMATTAFVLARRSHSDLLLSCCSRLLAEHAQQRGDAAKAVKLLASADARPYARPERSDRRRDDLRSSSDHDEPGQRWGHDGFEAGSGAAAAPVIAPPAKDMTQKVKISNLYHNVSREDLEELFWMPDGLLVSAKLSYDSSGRSNGWGELVFINREIAQTAIKQFNGVELDGEPMRIELIEPVTGRLGPRTGGAPQAAQPRAERSERQKPQRSLDDRLGKRLEERLGKRLDERLGDKVEPRGRAARSDGDWGAAREATLSSGGRESRGPRGRGGRRPGASSRDTTGMDLDGELDQYMSQASNRNAAPAVREIISYADADAPHGAVASF
ncbi:hypothetical protein HK105_202488 [Polyrhizophydium stewartii]|uniref:RRM domain-containing protein n=1 Tax=Polyrhizophydium stewartii TaxID=2732419 RepID=A0ABR4NF32_9FUNG